jgi:hypothetical protein
MTAEEYADYQQGVANFKESVGADILTTNGEAWFSWCHCDCCGTMKGGDRYEGKGVTCGEDGKVVWEGRVCEDCEYYWQHGRLDDKTMMKIMEGGK